MACCVGRQGRTVAEDCGGIGGWKALKKSLSTGQTGLNGHDRRDWYKKNCANGARKGLDSWTLDLFDVNDALADEFLSGTCQRTCGQEVAEAGENEKAFSVIEVLIM